jgi:hypothetical protein
LTRNLMPIEQILTLLTDAPRQIATATEALTPEQLHTSPADGEWSTNDVLAHLRACADRWGGSALTILAEDHPTIRAINPRTWIKQTNYPDLDFRSSLAEFTTQRAELLAALEPLSPDDWSRSATITGAGRPLIRTVHSYADSLARHERPHIKQIARTVIALQELQQSTE